MSKVASLPATVCVGTGTDPLDRPRTTSLHVLHASVASLAPLEEACATVYESCLESVRQGSADLSGSSGSIVLTDRSHQVSQVTY
jgi:hypothetical protein